ncbi:MAG: hypothetical protein ABW187_00660 [Dokdonella sp.]
MKDFADRLTSTSARMPPRRDGAVGIASAQAGAWVEFDMRGARAADDGRSFIRISIELLRESGAAELAALITSAVADGLVGGFQAAAQHD